jgi:hypothetical protein
MPSKRPITPSDEWGIADPAKAGMPALYARLGRPAVRAPAARLRGERTPRRERARDGIGLAMAEAMRLAEQMRAMTRNFASLAAGVSESGPSAATPIAPAPTSRARGAVPLAAWAHALAIKPHPARRLGDHGAFWRGIFRIPVEIALVEYARGCRIHHVHIEGAPTPDGQHEPANGGNGPVATPR